MLRWQVGEVSITRIMELEMSVAYDPKAPFLVHATPARLREMPWLHPHFVTEDGALKFSIHALWVEAKGSSLVVDTCIGNDKPRSLVQGQPLQTDFLTRLEAAGCRREEVDTVVCTHLHLDHVGWNTMRVDGAWQPTFPNARYLVGRQEYASARKNPDPEQQAVLGDSIQPIFDRGLATLVEMDHRISPEVSLVPTPGHTPGHVSVEIESAGQRALITGDMLHHPCQIACPEWSIEFDSDPVESATTRRRMLEAVADEPVLVIGTHFSSPTAGHVRRDGRAFRFDAP